MSSSSCRRRRAVISAESGGDAQWSVGLSVAQPPVSPAVAARARLAPSSGADCHMKKMVNVAVLSQRPSRPDRRDRLTARHPGTVERSLWLCYRISQRLLLLEFFPARTQSRLRSGRSIQKGLRTAVGGQVPNQSEFDFQSTPCDRSASAAAPGSWGSPTALSDQRSTMPSRRSHRDGEQCVWPRSIEQRRDWSLPKARWTLTRRQPLCLGLTIHRKEMGP